MALANYTDLQTAVAEWLAKANLSTRAPDFIRLGESVLNRRVRIRQSMTTGTLTLSAGAASVALPADFLEEIELNYTDQAEALTRAPFDRIDQNAADSTAGRPCYYAITDTSVAFETEADQEYTLLLRYYKKWDIAADTTNWLLTNAPDAYLFASLAEAADYQRDYTAYQKYIVRRDDAIFDVLKADSRNKRAVLTVDPALRGVGRFDIVSGQ